MVLQLPLNNGDGDFISNNPDLVRQFHLKKQGRLVRTPFIRRLPSLIYELTLFKEAVPWQITINQGIVGWN